MKINRILLVGLVPLTVAACEGEADQTGETADSIAAGQSLPVDTVSVTGDGAMQAAVVLNELAGSGVSGEATLSPGDASTQTTANLTLRAAGGAGGVHQGHIHSGTCTQIGGVVVPLPPVTVAGGTGTATSSVAVDAMSVMDGAHVVVYHEAGGNPGSPVVCGEIPGHVM